MILPAIVTFRQNILRAELKHGLGGGNIKSPNELGLKAAIEQFNDVGLVRLVH